MYAQAKKTKEDKGGAVSQSLPETKRSSESVSQFVDNRPESIAQRKVYELANNLSDTPTTSDNKVIQCGAYAIGGGYTFTSSSGKLTTSSSKTGNSGKKLAIVYGQVTNAGSYNKSGEVHAHLSDPLGKIGPGMKITYTSGAHIDTGGVRYYPFSCGQGGGVINGILSAMLDEHISGWDDYP